MEFVHIVVAVGFGKNRSRRNRQKFTVAFNHTIKRNLFVWFESVSVNYNMFGGNRKFV